MATAAQKAAQARLSAAAKQAKGLKGPAFRAKIKSILSGSRSGPAASTSRAASTVRRGVQRTTRVVRRGTEAVRRANPIDKLMWSAPEAANAGYALSQLQAGALLEPVARETIARETAMRTGFRIQVMKTGTSVSPAVQNLVAGYGPYAVYKGVGRLRRFVGMPSKPSRNAGLLDRFTYHLPEIGSALVAGNTLKVTGNAGLAVQDAIGQETAMRSGIRVDSNSLSGYKVDFDAFLAGTAPNLAYRGILKGLSFLGIRKPRRARSAA